MDVPVLEMSFEYHLKAHPTRDLSDATLRSAPALGVRRRHAPKSARKYIRAPATVRMYAAVEALMIRTPSIANTI